MPVHLDEVLRTEELSQRSPRLPQYEAENRALHGLVAELASRPQNLLQKLAETVLDLCRAESAGVSIPVPGEPGTFRCDAVAGRALCLAGATLPRDDSPCGTVVDRDAAQLFDRPHRHFEALARVEPLINESLLVPFHVEGKPVGTIWAVGHTTECRFDAEDARLMASVSRFAWAGYRVANALAEARSRRGRLEQRAQAQMRHLELESTRRERAEQALGASEARYRTLFGSIDEGFCILQPIFGAGHDPIDYRYVEVNPVFEQLTGVRNAAGRTMRELAPEADANWIELYGPVALTGEPWRCVHRDESRGRWLDVFAFALGDSEQRQVAVTCKDVTDRKRDEDVLRRSEARYRMLFNSIDEGFCIMEAILEPEQPADFRILEVNPAFERVTGVQNPCGRLMRELADGFDEFWYETFARVARSGEPARFDGEVRGYGGRWYRVYAFRLGGQPGNQVAVLFRDITRRRRLYRELSALNRSLERQVEARTLEVRELATNLAVAEQVERRRIARVLHDDLQQQLFAVQMRMDLLAQDLATLQDHCCQRELEGLRAWVTNAIQTSRQLAIDLNPPLLRHEGLPEAIGWLASQMAERYRLRVSMDIEADLQLSSEDLQSVLLQCVRELLFNVVKHADVDEARVEARRDGAHVRVVVSDTGAGFESARVARSGSGYGIFSLSERVRLFGGEVAIASAPGRGTHVTITVPETALRRTDG
jgi:PAS domain S-box-containing protein